jgi:hypothetical protein
LKRILPVAPNVCPDPSRITIERHDCVQFAQPTVAGRFQRLQAEALPGSRAVALFDANRRNRS